MLKKNRPNCISIKFMRQSGEMMGLFVQSILSPDSIFKIIVEHWKIEINKKGNLSLISDNYIFFVRRKQILCLSCNNSIIYSIVCLFFFTSTELFAVHSETDRKTESKQRNLKNFFVKCLKFYVFCKLHLSHRIYVWIE